MGASVHDRGSLIRQVRSRSAVKLSRRRNQEKPYRGRSPFDHDRVPLLNNEKATTKVGSDSTSNSNDRDLPEADIVEGILLITDVASSTFGRRPVSPSGRRPGGRFAKSS
jgi:hypothetical protein